MNCSAEQRLHPASLITVAAISVAPAGTGHIERKSKVGIERCFGHRWREEQVKESMSGGQRYGVITSSRLTGLGPFHWEQTGYLVSLPGIRQIILLQIRHKNMCWGALLRLWDLTRRPVAISTLSKVKLQSKAGEGGSVLCISNIISEEQVPALHRFCRDRKPWGKGSAPGVRIWRGEGLIVV